MKRLLFRFLGLACFFLLVLQVRIGVAAPYISVDVATGEVLAHNQAFDRWYPASLTKMMTAYAAFKAIEAGEISLDTPITLSANAAKVPPSRSGYKAGSVMTLDTALTITLVRSANDLAVAIGEAVSGSQKAFVARMNDHAKRLGMNGTHFANANGLPHAQNYSTARDMAVLAVQIRREFPQYAHYFAIAAIDFGDGKPQSNSNNLIGRYNGADGMKTGFICASGFNLAASASRKGRSIVTVVLGAERIDQRENLAAELLSQGFSVKSGGRTTLNSLRPYGNKLTQATDLRASICSEGAYAERMQYRDEEGNILFDTAFMNLLQKKPKAVPVRLLSLPQALKKGEIPIWQVPIPAERPPRPDAAKPSVGKKRSLYIP